MNPPVPSRIRQTPKSLFPYLFAGLFLLAFFDSWHRAGIDPKIFFEPRGQQALGKFLTGMFPPDLSPAFLSL
ncbi:MAG: ABC transporter permease, partial [Candidatus Binatia bacterium]|nr:ABC transporter permease [Candidatus Binatia bacterium]